MDRTTTTYFAELLDNSLLSPHLRRLTFAVPDDFESSGFADEWIRLFFPTAAGEPAVLPESAGKGWNFPDGVPREGRWYSIRRVEPGRIVIDVVVHDGGIGANWATHARTGEQIAVSGADGRYGADQPTDWEFIAADLTGLPAALRILTEMPADKPVVAVFEVPGVEDEQPVETAAEVDLRWIHNAEHGHAASRLPETIRAAPWREGTPYVWMSAEAAAHSGHSRVCPP